MSSSSSQNDADDDLGAIAEINVTPLVDVMLVLLIIFMVTAPLMLSQLPLKLPKASLEDMGKPRDPLLVSLDRDGTYYIDLGGGHTEQLTLDKLPARLHEIAVSQPDNIVYIRADKDAIFDKVRDILKMAAAAGFYKVSLVSEAPQ
jgi:biopolymer transport protein ExbD